MTYVVVYCISCLALLAYTSSLVKDGQSAMIWYNTIFSIFSLVPKKPVNVHTMQWLLPQFLVCLQTEWHKDVIYQYSFAHMYR
jgi:hypothetical protein